ncbi:toll/interleukin-1 receptor domain-containing protein [Nostoc sp. TCL240-02]|uniref:toll/interleukin-1 receptor domain-containing protein n=1 Tax=Nostoc sp. TCL240-02 TaxID=2572090 RepID=UPI00157FBA38|nr:toll/interleukin-1 receptor domain-containing protein [Nostoc sp. TCL240-02]QKQ76666.1 toll/interleukin-1 receptor domain-containing protein [Nostoc sp. TCL240-02]
MKIFLAHASEDKALVRDIHSRLLSHGFQPWLDELDILPGQTWRTAIPRAIRESDIFIACLSQRSVQKEGYVQREFRLALETYAEKPPETIYLIPLKFDNCEIPDIQLPNLGISLRDFQWLDFWKVDGFDRLVKSIEIEARKKNTYFEIESVVLDAETPQVSGIKSVMYDTETPSLSALELRTETVECKDKYPQTSVSESPEDVLTSEQKARRKFLKQAGFGGIGLVAIAVSYPAIFKPVYIPPETKNPVPRSPEPKDPVPVASDHLVATVVGLHVGIGAAAAACAATGVGLVLAPACGVVGGFMGAAAGFLSGW